MYAVIKSGGKQYRVESGAQVRVEHMEQSYWARRFDGARRVVTLQPAAEVQR